MGNHDLLTKILREDWGYQGIAKTRELQPGESQTLTMTIPVRDLSSSFLLKRFHEFFG